MFSNMSLAAVLAEAKKKFIAANPKSRAAHLQATVAMPGGNTRSVLFHDPFPLTMVRGEGCRLWDADGHCYVDLLGEYTAGLYGHSNPVIRAALDSALDGGWNLGGHGLMEARLAKLLCERFPSIDLVRFTNSGTEANMMAIATAVAVTGRRRIMVFHGGYHGGVLSFGGGGSPINAPYDWLVAPYNDSTTPIATDIACILVEPMQGSGGCIPATTEFLHTLRDGATSAGAILIFDEVMTSRMSAGGQQARLGIIPDMTTLGKYIGGGMSFGAFGGRRDIIERYDPRRPDAFKHAGTFNNNVLTMAAGYAGLTRLFTDEAAETLFCRGETLRARLNAIAAGLAMRWTGLGSLLCVHLDGAVGELFFLDMLAAGFYLARRGMIALSLEITDTEQYAFCAAVEEFVANRRPLLAA
jgi:glutamate-1-semialdehyde 2,1-aminomutase